MHGWFQIGLGSAVHLAAFWGAGQTRRYFHIRSALHFPEPEKGDVTRNMSLSDECLMYLQSWVSGSRTENSQRLLSGRNLRLSG
ncbi:hypothetical protein V8C35DRAFT_308910 [Trichoderma chlorosporum]